MFSILVTLSADGEILSPIWVDNVFYLGNTLLANVELLGTISHWIDTILTSIVSILPPSIWVIYFLIWR